MKKIVTFNEQEFDDILTIANSIEYSLNVIINSIKEDGEIKDSLYALDSEVESLVNRLR